VAVKRALLFRIGSNGLTCAAYEVAIEQATEHSKGTIRPIRDCPKPATEVVKNTGLCADCADVSVEAHKLTASRGGILRPRVNRVGWAAIPILAAIRTSNRLCAHRPTPIAALMGKTTRPQYCPLGSGSA
jgi:hypothetical protein